MSDRRVTISIPSIISIVLATMLIILLWRLRELLLLLMVAIVLAASVSPIVDWLETRKVPRWLAIALVYLVLVGGFVGLGLLIGPTVVQQTQRLISRLPAYYEALFVWLEDFASRLNASQPELVAQFINPQALVNWAIRSSQQVVLRSYGFTRGLVGYLVGFILVLLMSGYMLAGSKFLIQGIVQLFPSPWNQRLLAQVKPVTQRMGGFIAGRAIVSGILGVVITIGLNFLGLSEFALALGVIAGFMNLVPLIGPIVGAIPALIVALATGGFTWLWVLLLFVVVQNLEGNFLTPVLIGSSVKLHPFYVFLAVLGGTQVLGFLGALIVPPWVAGAAVILDNLYLQPKLAQEMAQLSPSSADMPHSIPIVPERPSTSLVGDDQPS